VAEDGGLVAAADRGLPRAVVVADHAGDGANRDFIAPEGAVHVDVPDHQVFVVVVTAAWRSYLSLLAGDGLYFGVVVEGVAAVGAADSGVLEAAEGGGINGDKTVDQDQKRSGA
jgi:hypothetical protein